MEKPSRRKVLAQAAGLVSVGALAGCSEDSSNNSSDGGDGGDGGDSTATPASDGEDSTTTPSGDGSDSGTSTPSDTIEDTVDVGGPGGDATMDLGVSSPGGSTIEDFEELRMYFERIVFETEGGDTAEVTVGKFVDLTEIDSSETVAEGVGFPSGTYATAQVTMPVASATLSDGSDPGFDLSQPIEVDLEILDELFVVESGDTVTFNLIPAISEFDGDYSFSFGHSRS